MKQAPKEFGGFKLVYQETFKSPFEKDSASDALRILSEIRKAHPTSRGWAEVEGYVEQLPNGKWRAVRNHALYRYAG